MRRRKGEGRDRLWNEMDDWKLGNVETNLRKMINWNAFRVSYIIFLFWWLIWCWTDDFIQPFIPAFILARILLYPFHLCPATFIIFSQLDHPRKNSSRTAGISHHVLRHFLARAYFRRRIFRFRRRDPRRLGVVRTGDFRRRRPESHLLRLWRLRRHLPRLPGRSFL